MLLSSTRRALFIAVHFILYLILCGGTQLLLALANSRTSRPTNYKAACTPTLLLLLFKP